MRALFVNNNIYKPFLLNSRAEVASRKNEQSTQMLWHGTPEAQHPQRHKAQCSCISCIGLRSALF